jgi:hypothetical protein
MNGGGGTQDTETTSVPHRAPLGRASRLPARTLLVQAEQGLGDTIQMARYLPLSVDQAGRVILACDGRLTSLLSQLPGVVAVRRDKPLPPYDVWVDQMSLPGLFGSTPTTVPAANGYLVADRARTARWRRQLLPSGRKAGIVWAGNPAHPNDRRRSTQLQQLAPLLATPGWSWISLQLGPARAQLGAFPTVTDVADRLIDLVIAVDTSTAHLAGALGVPAWVMLPFAPDWRWLLARADDTPWYASLRLFRQEAPGAWAPVVARVTAALAAMAE